MTALASPAATPAAIATPLLTPAEAAALLDQVLFDQVLECVDLDALYRVRASLSSAVAELLRVPIEPTELPLGSAARAEHIEQAADAMLARALLRVPDHASRYL